MVLYADAPTEARVHMWFVTDLGLAAVRVQVSPSAPITVEVPVMGLTVKPHIRVIPAAAVPVRVCQP
jgi:hypothetical protein